MKGLVFWERKRGPRSMSSWVINEIFLVGMLPIVFIIEGGLFNEIAHREVVTSIDEWGSGQYGPWYHEVESDWIILNLVEKIDRQVRWE